MTMPVMEPDLDAGLRWEWAQAIDNGPFASLCWGERVAFDNPETLTLMGALAAWTNRVRLVTTVIVPQLHDPVMLAKADVTDRVTPPGRVGVSRLEPMPHYSRTPHTRSVLHVVYRCQVCEVRPQCSCQRLRRRSGT